MGCMQIDYCMVIRYRYYLPTLEGVAGNSDLDKKKHVLSVPGKVVSHFLFMRCHSQLLKLQILK